MTRDTLHLWHDLGSARRREPDEMARRARRRLADLVAYARAHSPYYRALYRDLPDDVDDLSRLPVTSRSDLMARFDDWVTDPEVTEAGVRAFVARPELAGSRFLGRYLVATTSGTTGAPGIFVADDRTVAVGMALNLRMALGWLGPREITGILARGGRLAVLVATGGHFMVAAGSARLGPVARLTKVFSVHEPLPTLVEELNRFRPAVLFGYGSVIALLADEQAAGRLRIDPVLIEPGGETLAPEEHERIAATFRARVRSPYGSTECTFLSGGCEAGWHHVNTDWVTVEPVDTEHRPVPPGEPSTSLLLSNLANRVQPILRYDLGDSVLLRPDPCPCGNRLPALRVQGRAADVLRFATPAGEQVAIVPLTLATLVDRTPGVERFQLVQTSPSTLRVRLRARPDADPERVRAAVRGELTGLLARLDLGGVTVEDAAEPPQQAPGGKFRTVVPLAQPGAQPGTGGPASLRAGTSPDVRS